MLSFNNLHEITGRSTPDRMIDYKLALQLYKTLNYREPSNNWIRINLNIINTTRQIKFSINKNNRLKVGMNVLSNRFWNLNGKIEMEWFNLSFGTFKIFL